MKSVSHFYSLSRWFPLHFVLRPSGSVLPLQVERIALATLLADLSFTGMRKTVIGLLQVAALGRIGYEHGRAYGIIALTDPKSPGGYHAVRIIYGLAEPLPKAEDIPLEAVEVVFISDTDWTFVYDPEKAMMHILPDLKRKMQQGGSSPLGFAESFLRDDQQEKKPNPASEPTAPSGRGSP